MASFSKTFDFNLRRDRQKISYERRDYVYRQTMSRKTTKKKNSGGKGLSFDSNNVTDESSFISGGRLYHILIALKQLLILANSFETVGRE